LCVTYVPAITDQGDRVADHLDQECANPQARLRASEFHSLHPRIDIPTGCCVQCRTVGFPHSLGGDDAVRL
jgi:hypothetical protein